MDYARSAGKRSLTSRACALETLKKEPKQKSVKAQLACQWIRMFQGLFSSCIRMLDFKQFKPADDGFWFCY